MKERLVREREEDRWLALEEEWMREEEEENMQVLEYQQCHEAPEVQFEDKGSSAEKKKPNLPPLVLPDD